MEDFGLLGLDFMDVHTEVYELIFLRIDGMEIFV